MGAIEVARRALPSVERARALLAECRSTNEVRKIRAIAQAVATLERGKEIAIDAGEIVVWADRRIGELSRELPKAPPPAKGEVRSERRTVPGAKTHALAAHGLTKQRASEAEKIAAMPEKDVRAYLSASRKAGQVPSSVTAATLGKLEPDVREKTLAKLGDVPDVRRAVNAVKLEAKRELAEEIRATPIVTPEGQYQVIAIDPPWKYDSRAEDTTHRGKNLYPEMTVEEICALPVAKLAQEDCVLWLWTTNAFMRDAYRCLDAWGFAEKTILTWDKEMLGLGDWLRNVTEHCILAVRGHPIVSLTNQTTLIREKRREHSRKPEAFYALVEALCPGSKLEMFSRATRDGWAAWGAEPDKFKGAA